MYGDMNLPPEQGVPGMTKQPSMTKQPGMLKEHCDEQLSVGANDWAVEEEVGASFASDALHKAFGHGGKVFQVKACRILPNGAVMAVPAMTRRIAMTRLWPSLPCQPPLQCHPP